MWNSDKVNAPNQILSQRSIRIFTRQHGRQSLSGCNVQVCCLLVQSSVPNNVLVASNSQSEKLLRSSPRTEGAPSCEALASVLQQDTTIVVYRQYYNSSGGNKVTGNLAASKSIPCVKTKSHVQSHWKAGTNTHGYDNFSVDRVEQLSV